MNRMLVAVFAVVFVGNLGLVAARGEAQEKGNRHDQGEDHR